jgi:hypothetical protein
MGKFSRDGFWRRIVCAGSVLAAGCTNPPQKTEDREQRSDFCLLSSAFCLLSFRRKNEKDRS